MTLSAWQGGALPVCVGTCRVDGHEPLTYISLRKAQPCTLKWRRPGGPLCERTARPGKQVVLPGR